MSLHTSDLVLVPGQQLPPLETISGFQVRPGFFRFFGATVIPGGVNFTIQSHGATSCELLLFHKGEEEPFAVLPFPEHYKIGFVYSMIVFGFDIEEYEYAYRLDGPYDEKQGLRFDPAKILLDPYARSVTGQSHWGCVNHTSHGYRARVTHNNFDWGDSRHAQIPMEDLIIYELHVRGFTQDSSSGVKCPGTFRGLEEKIPYLKELGINAVELMPIFEFDEMRNARLIDENQLIDYWGYNPVSFFSPNSSYASKKEENNEGTELGPCFSFKGFDNNIYYMLTPDGYYYNFSGCGNTLNCNHPVVRELILDCLRYWVTDYRVDGFRFDLASILGRNEDGSPMSQPPLLQSLAFDPILGNVKLIAEAWDAGGLYQVGSFPSWRRWAEWNGRYRDDMRRFLKGDDGLHETALKRILGSPDLYNPQYRGGNASVNFLTCHDGFTLCDLYSYNQKHNEANGWNNTDGCDDNHSWNCGEEGETSNPEILRLRLKMMQNACALLMCSRGTPMFLSGDEFADTRFGNNNPYCQDNEISWLDWSLLSKNQALFAFFQYMISFRKQHPAIRRNLEPSYTSYPSMSGHGLTPEPPVPSSDSHTACVMFAGFDEKTGQEDLVFLAVNAHWIAKQLVLPSLPNGYVWKIAVNTGDLLHQTFSGNDMPTAGQTVLLGERSVIVFAGMKQAETASL